MTSEATPAKVPLRAKIAYGLGDFGSNLMWQGVSLYLLYYCTEVLRIPADTAGLIVMIALIWDGVVDVTMGSIADRTQSRWGRYRPYLLFGAVPMGVFFVLVYTPIPGVEGSAVAVVALITQILFRTAYAVVSIPYGSLTSAMTGDSAERASIAGYRMIFANLGGLAIALSMMPLIKALGAGDLARGFPLAAIVLAVLAVILTWVCFAGTREQPQPAGETAYRIVDLPRLALANPPFLIVIACMILSTTGITIVATFMPYFFKYAIGNEGQMGLALGIVITGTVCFIPVWMAIAKRAGKRNVWIAGAAWAAASLLLLYWAAPLSFAAMAPFLLLSSFGFAALSLTGFGLLPDTVEYGEWKTGRKAEAGLYSVMILAQKVSLGLASWFVGVSLANAGYTAESGLPAEGIASMTQAMLLMPVVLYLASIAVIWRYPISEAFHARLRRALQRRRKL
jgi:GPH family glycoside/pentoside/hexuronide:cation symporter